MQAAVCRRYGPPDVVRVEERPVPRPRDDEILVRVRAATVGVADVLARRGSPFYVRVRFGLRRPRFPVLGSDFAGQVEETGRAVRRFGVGDVVFGTDYTRTDFTRAGRRYDVIFDVAGTSSYLRCRRALNRRGSRPVDAGHKKGNIVVVMA